MHACAAHYVQQTDGGSWRSLLASVRFSFVVLGASDHRRSTFSAVESALAVRASLQRFDGRFFTVEDASTCPNAAQVEALSGVWQLSRSGHGKTPSSGWWCPRLWSVSRCVPRDRLGSAIFGPARCGNGACPPFRSTTVPGVVLARAARPEQPARRTTRRARHPASNPPTQPGCPVLIR